MKPGDQNGMQHTEQYQKKTLRSGAIGRPRKGEADQRRSHLIGVASTLFLERGYYRVSLALIAQQARVAVRTIYLGFGGKGGLFSAVLQQGLQRCMIDQQVLDPTGPIIEVLGNFGLCYLRYLTDPQMVKLRRMVIAEANTSPDLEQTWWDAGPALTRALLTRYFYDLRVRSQMHPDVPLDLLPIHFMACIAGEYGWPRAPSTDATGGRTLQQLLDARIALFSRSVLIESPRV